MKEVYPALVLVEGYVSTGVSLERCRVTLCQMGQAELPAERRPYSLLLIQRVRALEMPLVQPPASTPKGYVKRVY